MAERDQIDALAEELNREFVGWPPRTLNADEIVELEWRLALKGFWEEVC